MTAPNTPYAPSAAPPASPKAGQTIKRPSVKTLLAQAKVTSATRELDISFAYDVTPAVVRTLCACMPQLRKLIVREVGLQSLPAEVGDLVHLRELDLSHNALAVLPPTLGRLGELQHLNVSRNRLAALPDTLDGMVNLRLLNANYNAIDALPPSFAALQALRVLRLGANELRALPLELARLMDLRLVQLAYNSIATVPDVLWDLPELKVVDLSYNAIDAWPATSLLPRTLSSLNLSGNPLSHVPPSLVAAQSHELKIMGLPKAGTRVIPGAAPPRGGGRPAPGEDNRLALNATQDLTGILFAGLGDFAVAGEPSTSPEAKQTHLDRTTEPDAQDPNRH